MHALCMCTAPPLHMHCAHASTPRHPCIHTHTHMHVHRATPAYMHAHTCMCPGESDFCADDSCNGSCGACNPIVACEARCGVVVHQGCYGLASPLPERWLCDVCEVAAQVQGPGPGPSGGGAGPGGTGHGPWARVQGAVSRVQGPGSRVEGPGPADGPPCDLCGFGGVGPERPGRAGKAPLSAHPMIAARPEIRPEIATSGGAWVHVSCAQHVSGFDFDVGPGGVKTGRGRPLCVWSRSEQQDLKRRRFVKCDVCGGKSGHKAQCDEPSCRVEMHVPCALQACACTCVHMRSAAAGEQPHTIIRTCTHVDTHMYTCVHMHVLRSCMTHMHMYIHVHVYERTYHHCTEPRPSPFLLHIFKSH